MGSKLPRGLRNNNPGNIRISDNKWRGKLPVDTKIDDEFERFVSLEMGARAQIINMRTHYRRGKNTIEKLISTWAPSVENPTEAYIVHVSKELGIPRNKQFAWTKENVIPIAIEIAQFENGNHELINKQLYERAWQLV